MRPFEDTQTGSEAQTSYQNGSSIKYDIKMRTGLKWRGTDCDVKL
jgi:hypothetical protein